MASGCGVQGNWEIVVSFLLNLIAILTDMPSQLNNILDIFLAASQITFAIAWAGFFDTSLFAQPYAQFSLALTMFCWFCYYLLKEEKS